MSDTKDTQMGKIIAVDFSKKNRPAPAPQDDQNKFEAFREWIAIGLVSLILDARKEAVLVPKEFKHQGDLRINFCHQFGVPDFNFNDQSVWGTLLFQSGQFFCRIPWEAVYSIQCLEAAQGAIWLKDFPRDLNPWDVLELHPEDDDGDFTDAPSNEGDELPKAPVITVDFSKTT